MWDKFQTIETVSEIGKKAFQKEFVLKSRPLLIKGYCYDWKATNKWNATYIGENFSNDKIGMMDIEESASKLSSYQLLPAKTLLENQNKAVASPLEHFSNDINNDYQIPSLCEKEAYLRSRIFIGPKNTVTALHKDIPENIYTLLNGKKKVLLFPANNKMYAQSILSKHPNFSKVDAEKPDFIRFPKLKNAQPYSVELNPGDALYIPSLWWHHMRNIEDATAINFWWSRSWQIPVSWLAVNYKKLIGV